MKLIHDFYLYILSIANYGLARVHDQLHAKQLYNDMYLADIYYFLVFQLEYWFFLLSEQYHYL